MIRLHYNAEQEHLIVTDGAAASVEGKASPALGGYIMKLVAVVDAARIPHYGVDERSRKRRDDAIEVAIERLDEERWTEDWS